MDRVYCDSNMMCPTDLSFIYKTDYVRRAGIIPFIIYNDITYILLGLSKEKYPVWADLGGKSEPKETTIQTALREYGEESRHVLSLSLIRINKILITSKNGIPDQAIFIVQIDPTHYNLNINDYFIKTIPKTQYEDEMQLLKWIPYDDFLLMNGLSDNMKQVQSLLLNFK